MREAPQIPAPYQEGFWEALTSQLTQPIYSYIVAGVFLALVVAIVVIRVSAAGRTRKKSRKGTAVLVKKWFDSRFATVLLLMLAASGLVFVFTGEAARRNKLNPCQGRPFSITIDDIDPSAVSARTPLSAVSRRARARNVPERISRNLKLTRRASNEQVFQAKRGRKLEMEMKAEKINGKWAVTEVTKCL